MNYFIVISILLLFIQITNSFEYGDEENQFSSHSIPSNSPHIDHLSSIIFDSLFPSNISLTSLFSSDQTINLHARGIADIEANTFENYHPLVKTIILSGNSLSYLPNHVFKRFRRSLTNLNLQRNQFYSLNENYFLRHLGQLRVLDMSKNQLKEILKENFIGLKRLDTLILRENQLTYLSYASFSHCRKITTLDLSDNQISFIAPNAFHLLNHLKILLLSNNPLGQRSLTNYLLKPLKSLQYLDLENTQLESLPPFLFLFNQRLQSVKLRRNHFQSENSNSTLQRTFCSAPSLVEIDLVSNQIHSLDVCTFHQLPSLRRLYLMNNPLDCTCDLLYLKYGDIYRLLAVDGNGVEQTNSNVDTHLNRWISRPELRRHLEKAFLRGDLSRLPIDLSTFARCTTPTEWNGYEINNITGIYSQCRHRWLALENQCHNYCQLKDRMETSSSSSTSLGCIQSWISRSFCLLPVIISLI